MTFTHKLGKREARRDDRNFKMKALLYKESVPVSYNFDNKHRKIPVPMFANDQYGDCVIAARAHQTLRFEHVEQGGKKYLPITDEDVLNEYFKETGGGDDGLYILDSLKLWRTVGWSAAGKNYKIKAFAEVDPQDIDEVKMTIFNDIGIMTGFSLPDSSLDEFDAGKEWTHTSDPPNPSNGHCVLVVGYAKDYLTCITWSHRQRMSYNFFRKYCDESYGCLDASNLGNINRMQLTAMLAKTH